MESRGRELNLGIGNADWSYNGRGLELYQDAVWGFKSVI